MRPLCLCHSLLAVSSTHRPRGIILILIGVDDCAVGANDNANDNDDHMRHAIEIIINQTRLNQSERWLTSACKARLDVKSDRAIVIKTAMGERKDRDRDRQRESEREIERELRKPSNRAPAY